MAKTQNKDADEVSSVDYPFIYTVAQPKGQSWLVVILPYLLLGTTQYILALALMLVIVVLIIAGFTYYTSVALDQPFKSRFTEMAAISIGVAVLSFFVGILAKRFLGVDL